jgi:hypothetical protein
MKEGGGEAGEIGVSHLQNKARTSPVFKSVIVAFARNELRPVAVRIA